MTLESLVLVWLYCTLSSPIEKHFFFQTRHLGCLKRVQSLWQHRMFGIFVVSFGWWNRFLSCYVAYTYLLGLQFLMTMSGHTQSEGSHQPDSKRAVNSCRKNVPGTSFVSDLRDHIHEFINASADEHRTCFTKTIQKMFGMSKIVAERSSEANEAGPESVLPLQTTVSR